MRAGLFHFTRPLVAGFVIMLLGMMAVQSHGMPFEGGDGSAVWTKASAKVQILAVINDTASSLKLAPPAKAQKAVWYELRSHPALPVVRRIHDLGPQVVLNAPALPQCAWVGVIVLRI